jgi:hypothetical protein
VSSFAGSREQERFRRRGAAGHEPAGEWHVFVGLGDTGMAGLGLDAVGRFTAIPTVRGHL